MSFGTPKVPLARQVQKGIAKWGYEELKKRYEAKLPKEGKTGLMAQAMRVKYTEALRLTELYAPPPLPSKSQSPLTSPTITTERAGEKHRISQMFGRARTHITTGLLQPFEKKRKGLKATVG